MNPKFRNRIALAYILIISLGILLSLITYNVGHTTLQASSPLIKQNLPDFENISDLHVDLTELEPILYEYYATTDRVYFRSRYNESIKKTEILLAKIDQSDFDADKLNELQQSYDGLKILAMQLDDTMKQSSVDWDRAREQLVLISANFNHLKKLINDFVDEIQLEILESSIIIDEKTNLMIQMVIFFSVIIFLISVFIAYYINIHFKDTAEKKQLAMFPEKNHGSVSQLSLEGDIIYTNPSSKIILEKLDIGSTDITLLFPDNLKQQLKELRESDMKLAKYVYSRGKHTLECHVHFIEEISTFHLYVEDITERKQAQDKIERFNRIFEDSLNEIYLFDAESLKFIQVNRTALRNLGYTMEELQEMTPFDMTIDVTAEAFAEMIVPLLKGEKERLIFEGTHQRKDKSLYDVEAHLQLLKYEHETLFAGIIIDITERKKTEDEIIQSQKKLRDLANRLQVVREEELTRISREIHDQLGQALTFLKIDMAGMIENIPSEQKELRDKARNNLMLIDETLQAVRQIAHSLRPALLDDVGLEAAIESQVEAFNKRIGEGSCGLELSAKDIGLDNTRDTVIFRTLQESLTNVVRHAQASATYR